MIRYIVTFLFIPTVLFSQEQENLEQTTPKEEVLKREEKKISKTNLKFFASIGYSNLKLTQKVLSDSSEFIIRANGVSSSIGIQRELRDRFSIGFDLQFTYGKYSQVSSPTSEIEVKGRNFEYLLRPYFLFKATEEIGISIGSQFGKFSGKYDQATSNGTLRTEYGGDVIGFQVLAEFKVNDSFTFYGEYSKKNYYDTEYNFLIEDVVLDDVESPSSDIKINSFGVGVKFSF